MENEILIPQPINSDDCIETTCDRHETVINEIFFFFKYIVCIKLFVSYEKFSHNVYVYIYTMCMDFFLYKQNKYISIVNQGLRGSIHVEDIACSWHRRITVNSTDSAQFVDLFYNKLLLFSSSEN